MEFMYLRLSMKRSILSFSSLLNFFFLYEGEVRICEKESERGRLFLQHQNRSLLFLLVGS